MSERKAKVRRSPVTKYRAARWILFAIVILTITSILLYITEADSSRFVLSLMLSLVYAAQETIGGYIVAAVFTGLFFICWLFSKRRGGWLIVALVLYIIDCLYTVLILLSVDDGMSLMFDLIARAVVIVLLIIGIKNRRVGTLTDKELLEAASAAGAATANIEGTDVTVSAPEVECNVAITGRDGGKPEIYVSCIARFGFEALILAGRTVAASALVGGMASRKELAVIGYREILKASVVKKRSFVLETAEKIYTLDAASRRERERLTELLSSKGVSVE